MLLQMDKNLYRTHFIVFKEKIVKQEIICYPRKFKQIEKPSSSNDFYSLILS